MINQTQKNDVEYGTIYNTELLKSHRCHYNDTYILVIDDFVTTKHNNSTLVAFKNCTPFTKCIKKIDGTILDGAEGLDLVMLTYNLVTYS